MASSLRRHLNLPSLRPGPSCAPITSHNTASLAPQGTSTPMTSGSPLQCRGSSCLEQMLGQFSGSYAAQGPNKRSPQLCPWLYEGKALLENSRAGSAEGTTRGEQV